MIAKGGLGYIYLCANNPCTPTPFNRPILARDLETGTDVALKLEPFQ